MSRLAVPSQQGLVLELEILGERHQDPLRDRPARGVLPGRHIGGDGREGGRVDPVRHAVEHLPRIGDHEAAGRRPRDDDPGPEDEDGGHDQADPQGAPGDPAAVAADQRSGREPPEVVGGRPRFGQESIEQRPCRADDDQAGEEPDLGPELVRLRAPSGACSPPPTRRPKTIRPTRPAGTVLGSVIMKNRKISTSGEVDDDPPEVDAADRRERPVRGHAVARLGQDADADAQGDPEGRGQGQQVQPPGDQQPAAR